jgi:riboflavin synthase
MFTGIVTDIGEVTGLSGEEDRRIVLRSAYPPAELPLGASVACSGVCLTVTEKGSDDKGPWFAVDASAETLRVTTLGGWRPGTKVNLERALKVGDELGGHIVAGHVDGVGRLETSAPEAHSRRLGFSLPQSLARFVAPKGSIAIDGVSLTVNAVQGGRFEVNIIPHTLAITTLGALTPGDAVNIEIDVMARYLARLAERDADGA